MDNYSVLRSKIQKVQKLRLIDETLKWDQEVVMPPESGLQRSELLSELSAVMHEKISSDEVGQLIAEARKEALSSEWDRRNLDLIEREYRFAKALPKKLVEAVALQSSNCAAVWGQAKHKNDWNSVLPEFEKMVAITKEKAKVCGDAFGCSPYDALLSTFSPAGKQAVVDPLFTQLKNTLPDLAKEITDKQKNLPAIKSFAFAKNKHMALGKDIASTLGFNFQKGRIDLSVHPFSSGSKQDMRITTYDSDNVLSVIYGTIHETGHSLYVQQTPEEWQYDFIGAMDMASLALDMSIHESQALFYEKQVGLHPEFIKNLYEKMAKEDNDFAAQGSVNDFQNNLYQVKPSFIRVDADEVTYPLHIMLRYELEKALFSDEIAVKDLPHLWGEKFKDYFGLDIPEYRLGHMQDIHWYIGWFGYFPTYTQGALYAAQFMHAAKHALPDMEQNIQVNEFKPLKAWLENNIHSKGQLYDAPDLMEQVTGEKPNAQYFLNHLKNRYL